MLPFVGLGYLTGMFKTPKKGAETSIYLAETDGLESGLYWENNKVIQTNPISQDRAYAEEVIAWCNGLLEL